VQSLGTTELHQTNRGGSASGPRRPPQFSPGEALHREGAVDKGVLCRGLLRRRRPSRRAGADTWPSSSRQACRWPRHRRTARGDGRCRRQDRRRLLRPRARNPPRTAPRSPIHNYCQYLNCVTYRPAARTEEGRGWQLQWSVGRLARASTRCTCQTRMNSLPRAYTVMSPSELIFTARP
jgi:hypothetical protein